MLPFLAASATHSIHCGRPQIPHTSPPRCTCRGISRSPDTSASPPSSFGQKISQKLHLHPQLHDLIVSLHFLACRLLARTFLGAWYVSLCNHLFFSSLAFHELSQLLLLQPIAGCDFCIRLSLLMACPHQFCQAFYLCVSSCHAKTSCRSFYSTTGGLFFLLSVIRGTVHLSGRKLQFCFRGCATAPLQWNTESKVKPDDVLVADGAGPYLVVTSPSLD